MSPPQKKRNNSTPEDLLLCVSGAEGDEAYGTPCRVPAPVSRLFAAKVVASNNYA